MQHDDVIWQVINDQFCSFKVKTDSALFCRNEYNVTGLCNRQSCPLANSQYATVRELDGKLYLMKKTIERAHSPAKMWERIILNKHNKEEGLEKIAKELQYWSPFLMDKCKLRFERLLQVQKTTHKLVLKAKDQPILTTRASKVERREKGRERKAKIAAKLEMTIEKELVERLRQGVYGDMYNLDQKAFNQVLDAGTQQELNEEEDAELEEEYEFVEGEESEELDTEEYEVESEQEDMEDMKPATKKSGPYVEIEYETEEPQVQMKN